MKHLPVYSLLSLVLLAGCQMQEPDQARNNPARFQGLSHHSVSQVTDCIYRGWSSTEVVVKDDTTHQQQDANRTTVLTWGDSMFTDITPRGKGAEVKFFTTFNMGPEVLADRKRIVQRCT